MTLKYMKTTINPFEKAPDPDKPLEIVIARANTMDLDGDIFQSYVWKDAGVLMSPWGHSMREVPVAASVPSLRKDDAVLYVPEFTKGDEVAERTERALRQYWKIVEFSYAFYPTKEYYWAENPEAPYGRSIIFTEVEIYEASPVHKGASIDTGIGKEWRKEILGDRQYQSRDAEVDLKSLTAMTRARILSLN